MLSEFLAGYDSYDTVKTYKSVLCRFLKFVKELGKDINTIDEKVLNVYASKFKPATYNKILTIVNTYRKYETGKSFNIKKIKYDNFQKERIVSYDEVKELIKYTNNNRDALMIKTLFQTGIRVSELSRIQKEDIIREKGKYYLYFISKGAKKNKKEIPESLAKELLSFDSFDKSLFGIGSRHIIRIITKLGKEVLGRNITPHCFRHGYATFLHEQGASLEAIQNLLGHKSKETTKRYLHVADTQENWLIEF